MFNAEPVQGMNSREEYSLKRLEPLDGIASVFFTYQLSILAILSYL